MTGNDAGEHAKTEAIATIVADPNWLPHRYDPDRDTIHFLRVDRVAHRAATFLTDADLPAGLPSVVLRRSDLSPVIRSDTAPIHFMFHSAYCCSTLMARVLDQEGAAMTLKEPQILNDIVGWRRRGGKADRIGRVLDDVLALLARPFGAGERVIVKPSNVVNAIAAAILRRNAKSNALLLYAPLSVYLASIAAKRMQGALWVRQHFIGALRDGIVDLGLDSEQLFGQTDLQIAAMGWLAQQALFAKMLSGFGARVHPLDSESLLAAKALEIANASMLFGLPLDRDRIEAITGGPVFQRHSKSAMAFVTSDRADAQRDARAMAGQDLDKICQWTVEVAKRAGIPLTLVAATAP